MWMRIKQFWTDEKWLRVIDDKTKLRWVGLNQKITLQMALEEVINDESLGVEERTQAQMQLQQMSQNQDPRLQQVIESRNDVSEIDVDIIIETSYDLVNIQREQFDLLAKIAQTRPDIPFTEILKLSELRGKDKVIKSIEASSQAASQAQQQAMQIDQAEKESKIGVNQAKTNKDNMAANKSKVDADLTQLQTEIILKEGVEDAAVIL